MANEPKGWNSKIDAKALMAELSKMTLPDSRFFSDRYVHPEFRKALQHIPPEKKSMKKNVILSWFRSAPDMVLYLAQVKTWDLDKLEPQDCGWHTEKDYYKQSDNSWHFESPEGGIWVVGESGKKNGTSISTETYFVIEGTAARILGNGDIGRDAALALYLQQQGVKPEDLTPPTPKNEIVKRTLKDYTTEEINEELKRRGIWFTE